MHESLRLLQKLGYVRFNPSSRWSFPVLIVPEPRKVDDFKITVDNRYPKSQIIPVVSPMTILDVILQYLSGATIFASLDAFQSILAIPARCGQPGNLFFALGLGYLHNHKAHTRSN